jgi:outer membrane protein TolC
MPFSGWQVFDQEEFLGQHPLFNRYSLKRNQLVLEKRLREDKLKPNLVFSYNPIFEPVAGSPFSDFQWNNQKLGLSFYMPLFLRKERGDIRMANVDLLSLDFQVRDKAADLYAKYKAETDMYYTLAEQTRIFDEAVRLYQQMYTAEQRLFDIGESSLFLVNTREQNFVQAQLKRVEYVAKLQKAYFQVLLTAGKLADQFQ